MITETVEASWVAGSVFILRDRFGYPIRMTQPDGANGADLLPLSVCGCAAWDVAAILLKQRQPLTRLHVTAESQRDPNPPWRFRAMHLRYHFAGEGLDAERIRRAIALTETKYCSTFATLSAAVTLTSTFEIAPALEPGPRAAAPGDALAIVQRFNDALNAGNLEAMLACLSPDTVFENTYPPPDGVRHAGLEAVGAFWRGFLADAHQPRIAVEEIFAVPAEAQTRVVMRWTYHWLEANGQPGHIRGVDLYTVRDGLIAEKLSYVKG